MVTALATPCVGDNVNGDFKTEPLKFDPSTRLIVQVIHTALYGDNDERPEAFARISRAVQNVGPILIYLGLAIRDPQSPIGWRATDRLVDLMANRITRSHKPQAYRLTHKSFIVPYQIMGAVWGNIASAFRETSGGVFHEWPWSEATTTSIFVLVSLGLLWLDPRKHIRATPALYRLLKETGHGDILVRPGLENGRKSTSRLVEL